MRRGGQLYDPVLAFMGVWDEMTALHTGLESGSLSCITTDGTPTDEQLYMYHYLGSPSPPTAEHARRLPTKVRSLCLLGRTHVRWFPVSCAHERRPSRLPGASRPSELAGVQRCL